MKTVEILGIVDRQRHVYCRGCVDVTDYDSGYIWSDKLDGAERCDTCGALLADLRTVKATR